MHRQHSSQLGARAAAVSTSKRASNVSVAGAMRRSILPATPAFSQYGFPARRETLSVSLIRRIRS